MIRRSSALAIALAAGTLSAACGGTTPPGGAAPNDADRIVQSGIAVDLTVRPAGDTTDTAAVDRPPREFENAALRLELTDAETGEPVEDLHPAAWIDYRDEGSVTGPEVCRDKVETYIRGKIAARPAIDLNSYFVVALSESPNLVVIDPILGFGRTKLYTTVPLESAGHDWAISPGDEWIYVSLPGSDRIAVVHTQSWKVRTHIDAGPAPTELELQPDDRYLWVTHDSAADAEAAVSAVDPSTGEVVARFPVGAGPHVIGFSPDSRRVYVANRDAGTVTVIDADAMEKRRDVETGPRPVDLAYATERGAMYVADAEEGTLVALDGRTGKPVSRIELEPGLASIQFDPHADGHGGHGSGAAIGAGRTGFAANPETGTVTVLDALTGDVLRRIPVEGEPDKVAFSASFAYIRGAGTGMIRMVPLTDPTAGATGALDEFIAGDEPPGRVPPTLDAIVRSPEMGNAVYIMNAAERMIYYYHYMEGMPIPSGGLTTYGFDPKAIRVVGRSLRETAPGVYTATVRFDRADSYDLAFVSAEPRVIHCFPISVRANPEYRDDRVALDIQPLSDDKALTPGENRVRFRLIDRYRGRPLRDLEDLSVLVTTPRGWHRTFSGRPTGDGIYAADLSVPDAGPYFISLAIPSLDIGFRDEPPIVFHNGVRADEDASE